MDDTADDAGTTVYDALTPVYDPVKDGVAKHTEGVHYREDPPPAHLADLVHCFWELRSDGELADDFTLHAMPDACVNLLFDQVDPRIAGVTQLQTEHTTLPLGRRFAYAGIQFFPGVWRGDLADTVDHYVGEPYEGDLPLIEVGTEAAGLDTEARNQLFASFVERLTDDGLVAANPITAAILTRLDEVNSVAEMASVAALSPRQLQRALKSTTGFSPHDLLKVLRIQRSFREDYLLRFTDQSHFTHSFRKMTGYTPGRFDKTFDV
ncbi:MAG: helix-turn-helix domain-containing protein [Acidimicrobiales bacterium]